MIQTAGGNVSDKLVSRSGYGDFPAPTGNWTVLFRFKYNAPVTPGAYTSIFNLFDGATDFTTPYVFVGSQASTDNLFLEVYDGVTFVDSATVAITTSTQHWAAITYNASSHVHTLILDGSTIGTATLDMSAVTFDGVVLLGDGAGGLKIASSIAYCRGWSRLLSGAELTAEAAAITAVSTSNLLWDCPLQASIDLTSHNNTLNQLSATGTVTTDTTDPLLSIVAGPPTNTAPGTATPITADSAIFQDTLTAGAATSVWHVRTAIADGVWGACAVGNFTTYNPRIIVYEGLANALIDAQFVNSSFSRPIQFPVTAGTAYYFQTQRSGPTSPATAIISILDALDLPVPAGTIGIPDDSSPFALALLDVNTGYPIKFVQHFPSGEQGMMFPTGITVGGDTAASSSFVCSPAFAIVASPTFPATLYTIIGGNLTIALVAKQATGTFVTLTQAGVVGSTVYDAPTSIRSIAASPDSTIAYFADAGVVHQWDLVNNVALTDLVAAVVNYSLPPECIFTLPDGTIVVGYNRVGVNYFARLYNPDGTTILTTALFADSHTLDKIWPDTTDPTHFWMWSQDNDSSKFRKIKVSDGSVVSTLPDVKLFESGISQFAETPTPVRFGHSNSCPGWIVPTTPTPPTAALRLTQLPVEAAYDYGMLQPFVKGSGLDWVTPPKTLT